MAENNVSGPPIPTARSSKPVSEALLNEKVRNAPATWDPRLQGGKGCKAFPERRGKGPWASIVSHALGAKTPIPSSSSRLRIPTSPPNMALIRSV